MDIQYVLAHELGHVLGFADDDTPVWADSLETIMSHGKYWLGREIQKQLRNTFGKLYDIDVKSPYLPVAKGIGRGDKK